MNKEDFIKALTNLNINITDKQLKDLDTYYHLLVNENKKYNLTAITEEKSAYLKHFYDSLTIVKSITLSNQYICDIGSGAGFPGLVLKIIFPEIKIDLLDATTKKCEFLKLVITKLNLKNISVINARCEEYDIVVSRAVAPLKHLLEYSIQLLKINGTFVSLKANIDNELINIDNYYQKLFLSNENIIKFKLPIEESNRTIYRIQKTSKTPLIYPRTYIQIKKKEI